MKSNMTYFEAVKLSWQNELQNKNLWRILRLAFFTVYFSIVRVFIVMIPNSLRSLFSKTK